jgi:hypothetical protein
MFERIATQARPVMNITGLSGLVCSSVSTFFAWLESF